MNSHMFVGIILGATVLIGLIAIVFYQASSDPQVAPPTAVSVDTN